MSDTEKNLYYLEDLPDYQVAADYSDVRGWDVVDADNRVVGKVTNLLVNKKTERVIYLDVEVDKSLIEEGYNTYQVPESQGIHGFLNKEGEDHLIIPIGMAKLDEGKKNVCTNHINHNTFTKARRFIKGADVGREYELILLRHYIADNTTDIDVLYEKFYKVKAFDDTLKRKES
ncbi:MAG: PRC-barrel domain-containing protein [bacterium]